MWRSLLTLGLSGVRAPIEGQHHDFFVFHFQRRPSRRVARSSRLLPLFGLLGGLTLSSLAIANPGDVFFSNPQLENRVAEINKATALTRSMCFDRNRMGMQNLYGVNYAKDPYGVRDCDEVFEEYRKALRGVTDVDRALGEYNRLSQGQRPKLVLDQLSRGEEQQILADLAMLKKNMPPRGICGEWAQIIQSDLQAGKFDQAREKYRKKAYPECSINNPRWLTFMNNMFASFDELERQKRAAVDPCDYILSDAYTQKGSYEINPITECQEKRERQRKPCQPYKDGDKTYIDVCTPEEIAAQKKADAAAKNKDKTKPDDDFAAKLSAIRKDVSAKGSQNQQPEFHFDSSQMDQALAQATSQLDQVNQQSLASMNASVQQTYANIAAQAAAKNANQSGGGMANLSPQCQKMVSGIKAPPVANNGAACPAFQAQAQFYAQVASVAERCATPAEAADARRAAREAAAAAQQFCGSNYGAAPRIQSAPAPSRRVAPQVNVPPVQAECAKDLIGNNCP